MRQRAEMPREPGTIAPPAPFPEAMTYFAAITACREGNQWERALVLLEDMQAQVTLLMVVECPVFAAVCARPVCKVTSLEKKRQGWFGSV